MRKSESGENVKYFFIDKISLLGKRKVENALSIVRIKANIVLNNNRLRSTRIGKNLICNKILIYTLTTYAVGLYPFPQRQFKEYKTRQNPAVLARAIYLMGAGAPIFVYHCNTTYLVFRAGFLI